jgi:HK97 family phage prohead protease
MSPRHLSGYAAVFDAIADLGGFRECLEPGCFSRCLGGSPDVRALYNHDPSQILGRTVVGTLRLNEDDQGLHFDCDLPDTQAARDLREAVSRGDVSQCSFGFVCRQDNWTDGPDGPLRTLTDVDLLDVSPVTYPAYPTTSCSVRALWPGGVPTRITRITLRTRIGRQVAGGGLYSLRTGRILHCDRGLGFWPAMTVDGPLETERMLLRCQVELLDE